jgi:hypothetical protein
MKKQICSCFLLFFAVLNTYRANAQKIYFSDTTNIWRTTHTAFPDGPNSGSTQYWLIEALDTAVVWNGHTYGLVRQSSGFDGGPPLDMLVREDTAGGKVYIKPLDWGSTSLFTVTDTNEFVYMDYNLSAGDSIIMPLVFIWETDSISVHKVFDIDSVLVENIWYKRFGMHAYRGMSQPNSDPGFYRLTEGIGSLSGPVIIPSGINEWGPPLLICFSNQGIIPSIFVQNCFNILSVDKISKENNAFKVYPNPADDKLTISLDKARPKHYQIRVVNLMGQVLAEEHFQKETTLSLERYPAGIYLLQISEGGQLIQSDKLFIRH